MDRRKRKKVTTTVPNWKVGIVVEKIFFAGLMGEETNWEKQIDAAADVVTTAKNDCVNGAKMKFFLCVCQCVIKLV